MPKKTTAQRIVMAKDIRNFGKFFSLSAAQERIIVTDEKAKIVVFNAPNGTFKMDEPAGQLGAPMRIKM